MLSVNSTTEVAKVEAPEPTKDIQATSKPETVSPKADTAQISSAAQSAAKAAVQEATETTAQTAKEAAALFVLRATSPFEWLAGGTMLPEGWGLLKSRRDAR
jgi:hypothetical protein